MSERISICHPPKINKGRGLCGNCYDKWLKKQNPEYKKRQAEISKLWRLNNKEKCKEHGRLRWIKTKDNPEHREKRFYVILKNKYGLLKDDYLIFLKKNDGKCHICSRSPAVGKKLHVDHCHKTGIVRGLLCAECNWYMAKFDKIPNLMDIIEQYLNKDKK